MHDDPYCPTAGRAGLDLRAAHPFQALCPRHLVTVFEGRLRSYGTAHVQGAKCERQEKVVLSHSQSTLQRNRPSGFNGGS